MLMPGRSYTATGSGGYRYGFNGKEKSDEIEGNGVDYDYGARIYDARVGKWFSTDPVVKPWLSLYEFGANNPINFIDKGGEDEYHFHKYTFIQEINGKPVAQIRDALIIIRTNDNYDRFYYHTHTIAVRLPTGQHITSMEGEGVVELDPIHNPDHRSNITQTSMAVLPVSNVLWGGDRDIITLFKLISANPELKADLQRKANAKASSDQSEEAKDLLSGAKAYNVLDITRQGLELTATAVMLFDGVQGLAKGAFGTEKTVSFFSVQSEQDAARLISGGNPWPTGPSQAHLGPGFYSWATREEAVNYMNSFKISGVNLKIVEFSVPESTLNGFKSFKVPLDDNLANEWLSKHSSLYGEGLPHGYDYIQGNTGMGTEHYFTPHAFSNFKPIP